MIISRSISLPKITREACTFCVSYLVPLLGQTFYRESYLAYSQQDIHAIYWSNNITQVVQGGGHLVGFIYKLVLLAHSLQESNQH
jgi:hypothetical protein